VVLSSLGPGNGVPTSVHHCHVFKLSLTLVIKTASSKTCFSKWLPFIFRGLSKVRSIHNLSS
jgi:hypothetical protein